MIEIAERLLTSARAGYRSWKRAISSGSSARRRSAPRRGACRWRRRQRLDVGPQRRARLDRQVAEKDRPASVARTPCLPCSRAMSWSADDPLELAICWLTAEGVPKRGSGA
jgi:hypothetical protein